MGFSPKVKGLGKSFKQLARKWQAVESGRITKKLSRRPVTNGAWDAWVGGGNLGKSDPKQVGRVRDYFFPLLYYGIAHKHSGKGEAGR